MREIKFRGMLGSGEWVYGGYVKVKGGPNCILSGECDNYDIDGGVKNILKFNAVKYKTVGEYTGLKDKNGKEGYHKDLCKHPSGLYSIEWIATDAKFGLIQLQEGILKGNMLDIRYLETMEVIGNIYENPELLIGDKEGGKQ